MQKSRDGRDDQDQGQARGEVPRRQGLQGCDPVPEPGSGIIDPEQGAVVGPAQFVTQCVTIRKSLIK